MKIAVSSVGPNLESQIDPRFGRCTCFVIVETDDLSFEAVDNASQALGQGAGIQPACLMADSGVKFVLTGNCGPNAHQALLTAGITVIVGCVGTVREAVEQFKAGQLKPADKPNVPGHAGMDTPTQPATEPLAQPQGIRVSGRGKGMGRGRGMGCGRGQGGGRGMGAGRGRGGGR